MIWSDMYSDGWAVGTSDRDTEEDTLGYTLGDATQTELGVGDGVRCNWRWARVGANIGRDQERLRGQENIKWRGRQRVELVERERVYIWLVGGCLLVVYG